MLADDPDREYGAVPWLRVGGRPLKRSPLSFVQSVGLGWLGRQAERLVVDHQQYTAGLDGAICGPRPCVWGAMGGHNGDCRAAGPWHRRDSAHRVAGRHREGHPAAHGLYRRRRLHPRSLASRSITSSDPFLLVGVPSVGWRR